MKKSSKLLGLTLSAALLAGTLAGCTAPGGITPNKNTPAPTTSPTTSAQDAPPLVATEDVVEKLTGTPKDTVMFTVDGEDVTAEQLYYWLGVAADDEGGIDKIDWTAQVEGKSVADYILENARQAAQLYRVIETETAKAGVTLSAEDGTILQDQYAQTIEQFGEEEYARLLQQMAISDAGLRHMMEVSYLHTPLQEALFGEKGKTPPTSEAVMAMAEEQGLMLAKHILIKTVDDQRNPLSEEGQAAALTKAEGLLEQLRAVEGEEQTKLFDTLMNENSEDGRNQDGTLAAPEGYLFGAGQMVQEFEDGTRALEYGQISDLVKTEYGYHIILRLPPDNDEMRTQWMGTQMRELTDGWMKNAKVEDGPEMAKVDVKAFCEKLAEYRTSLEPAPTATPTPTPSAKG